MKNFLKKIVDGLIGAASLPFEIIFKFIKGADSALVKILRVSLLFLLGCGIAFVFVAKPYRFLSRDFRVEKYKTGQEAVDALLKLYPLGTASVRSYEAILKKNNILCAPEKRDGRDVLACEGIENKIYARYHWEIILRLSVRNKEKIRALNITKQKIDNSFQVLYKKFF
ncbi:MAG: hypothetical protein LBB09_01765 [Rickettsiales bacterium]|jgi:hypothetical protein|nr:hypothetical protein [Rickettsiales bacterium]